MPEEKETKKEISFVKKVWTVGLIFSLIAVVLLIFEATFDILVLVLAGILIASYFRGISNFLQRKYSWKPNLALITTVLVTFLALGGMFYFMGATVTSDTIQLKKSFPEMVNEVKVKLENSKVGKAIVTEAKSIRSSEEFSKSVSKFFSSTIGGLTNIYIVLLVGIFFTISPSIYTNGIVLLVPPKKRQKANTLLRLLGGSLQKWLMGKFIAMFAVFILTAIGLFILDVPMWLTLALFAGLLNFIPNFGPLAAAIPAVLVGMSEGVTTAWLVLALYFVVQMIESSLITPKTQQKLIKIPPALIILAQVFMGALSGIWGIIFATPLVLILIIVVQELYTKPMNNKSKAISN